MWRILFVDPNSIMLPRRACGTKSKWVEPNDRLVWSHATDVRQVNRRCELLYEQSSATAFVQRKELVAMHEAWADVIPYTLVHYPAVYQYPWVHCKMACRLQLQTAQWQTAVYNNIEGVFDRCSDDVTLWGT